MFYSNVDFIESLGWSVFSLWENSNVLSLMGVFDVPRRSSRGQTEGPGVVNWRLLPIKLQKVNLLLIVIIGDINQLFK